MEIAARVHPDHPERQEVFANRLDLFADGCLFADGAGYLIAHPGRMDTPPPLDSLLDGLPAAPDCLYLHDLALLPEWRGRGLAGQAVAMMVVLAKRVELPRLALVAVGNSAAFWVSRGFADVGPAPPSYGAARKMVLEL